MPYTEEETREKLDSDGRISGVVKIHLWDIIISDTESFNDAMNELLCESILSDLNFVVVGHLDLNYVLIEVSGVPA